MRMIRFGLAALVFSAASLSAAESNTDFTQLGEMALAAGDVGNAVSYLEKARAKAEGETWRELTLKLADLRLESNAPLAAEKLLAELAMRYPTEKLTERRLLEARTLLLQRRYADADLKLTALASEAGLPRERLAEVLAAQLRCRLAAGRYADAAETGEKLEALAPNRELQLQARGGRIFSAIMAGKTDESGKLLESMSRATPEAKKTAERLEMLKALQEKPFDEFLKYFAARRESNATIDVHADPLVYLIARMAGEKADAAKKPGAATTFYRIGVNAASSNAERVAMLRYLVNAQIAGSDATAAAGSIRKLLEIQPDVADRVPLWLQAARLFESGKQPAEALKCYQEITGNLKLPLRERLAAAREAALTASRANLPDEARRNLQYLVERASTPAERQDGCFLLGEFYYKLNEYGRAAESFAAAAEEHGPLTDRARLWQLQALVKAGSYPRAAELATVLKNSADPELLGAATYFQALLLERTGKTLEAEKAYLNFTAAYPGSEFAPAAGFDAAKLAEKRGAYDVAARLFANFAAGHTGHELAPHALWRSMQSAFLTRDDAQMRRAADELAKRYPASEYTASALFRQADFLRGEARYPAALAVLEKISATGVKAEVLAQCLLDQAEIHAHLSNDTRALELLQQLQEKYPASPVAADAALLAGNLYADRGEYAKAIVAYRRAAELRPSGRFAAVAAERLADCEFSAAVLSRDNDLLEQAIAHYRELAARNDPASHYSVGYKLGRALEQGQKPRAALGEYQQLLYEAAAARKRGEAVDPVWTAKAAYAAVMLQLKKKNPEAAREALRIIALARELGLCTSEDFDRIAAEARRKYRIQNVK